MMAPEEILLTDWRAIRAARCSYCGSANCYVDKTEPDAPEIRCTMCGTTVAWLVAPPVPLPVLPPQVRGRPPGPGKKWTRFSPRCANGLHDMTPENVAIVVRQDRGSCRRCLACHAETKRRRNARNRRGGRIA